MRAQQRSTLRRFVHGKLATAAFLAHSIVGFRILLFSKWPTLSVTKFHLPTSTIALQNENMIDSISREELATRAGASIQFRRSSSVSLEYALDHLLLAAVFQALSMEERASVFTLSKLRNQFTSINHIGRCARLAEAGARGVCSTRQPRPRPCSALLWRMVLSTASALKFPTEGGARVRQDEDTLWDCWSWRLEAID